jgi:imidazolonepropionase-like amidohydrolase
MRVSLRFAVVSAAGVVCAVPLAAQRNVPATYAITGARIVPVSGPAIDKGTIVIRDGMIAAVGPAVTAPVDARIIDGTGLTVYPGLIDAYGSLGQRTGATPAAATGGSRGGAVAATTAPREAAPNSSHPVGLQPEISIGKRANIVVTDGDLLEAKTNTKFLFIDGRQVPLDNKHTTLYTEFKDRP